MALSLTAGDADVGLYLDGRGIRATDAQVGAGVVDASAATAPCRPGLDNRAGICNYSKLCGAEPARRLLPSLLPAMWHDFWVAMALVFVIEGVFPFLAPNAMRRMMLDVARADNRTLRIVGLLSMIGGVGMLYLIN
jgi:uncharacterized protein